LVGKPLGRTRHKRKDNIKMDLRELDIKVVIGLNRAALADVRDYSGDRRTR
jgi:hypothetical protein